MRYRLLTTNKSKFIATLIILNIFIRILFWFAYEPVKYPDTGSYLRLAAQIEQLDFEKYNGRRTPVYPIFLVLCGRDLTTVWLFQMAMGVLISLMLFNLAWRVTHNSILSIALGLAYSLNTYYIFFEANILCETLCTFFILLCVTALSWLADDVGITNLSFRNFLVLGLGILVSLTALTRPLFLFLPVLLFFPLLYIIRTRSISGKLALSASYVLPVIVIVGGWCYFNHIRLGYFGPTTLTGYTLTQHSGAFIEYAPKEYSTIRDIYLKFREQRIAEKGTHSMTIWMAYPEMMAQTGLTLPELSKVLTKMSVDLFVHHPYLYLKSVFKGWVSFWKVMPPICYWEPQKLPFLNSSSIPLVVRWVQRLFFVIVNFVFLVFTAYSMASPQFRRKIGLDVKLFTIAAIILMTSVVQALTEYGENGRYAIPVQMLTMYFVLITSWRFLRSEKKRTRKEAEHQK